jgi:hypothetical protein
MIAQLEHWVGWGWTLLFVVWLAGTVFILTVIQRWFLERMATRIPTIVIFVIWTLAILAVGGKTLGFGPPPG